MLRTALFFLLQGAALAENHVFVSPNGSDVAPGNGSATFPFRTLAHALETDPQSDVTLLLLPGTFESAADSHLSVKGQRSVSIVSTASEVVIDLTSAGSPWLQVEDDAGAVLVANLTIRNGWGGSSISISGNQTKIIGVQFRNNTSPKQGGAIYLTTGSTIQNCSFVGNSAPSGGAVSTNEVIRQGGPLILDSLFDNNEAVTGGGAISLLAVGYVINCVFTNNRASLPTLGGGGIFLNGGISIRSAVMNCTFVNNTASGGGGALVLESYANVSFCSFSNNSAGDISRGGGAVLVAGDIRGNKQVTLISDCYFHNNFATNAGGALELAAVGSVVRCHFDSNQVTTFGGAGGGAIFIYSAVVPGPSIVDSLFTNNYGAGVAGAINFQSLAFISGCTFVNNSSPLAVEGIPAPGPLISNSKFLNSSESGALVLESPAQIENCTFAHNFAKGTKYGGGAIVVFSVRQSVPPVVRHCCFYDNGAETGGGAIYTYSALQIEDTVFTQNSATIYGALFRGVSAEPVAGGAVAVDPHAPGLFLARNVTFSSNTADKGGALFLGATSNVVGSTFEKNTAQSLGGAAVIGHDDVAFIGCIFTRNMAPKGSNLLLSEESAVNLQLSALCDHARNSIECVGNGSNGTIVGTFSSSLPHSDIAPAPCRIRDDHIVLPIEFNPTRLDTVWYFAVCGYQDSFLRLRRRVGAVVPEAALTALTMVLDSDPQASLSVTKPLPNSSSIEELMTESAYTHHARVQEGQHQASLSITNLKNGKCLAGCFPEFGVLISSPPTRVPTEYTRFVLSGQVEGISLSPAQSRVHILGGSIAFVGLTVQLLVQLRDDVGRPYASLVHIVHGNKRLACDGDSSSSALLLCTFTFETESLHATLELEDQHGNKLGRIGNSLTVISLVWPILGGALAFLALVSAVSLWAYRGWKRRRQHIADRLLQNYVGLDRGPTKEKQGWFGGGSEAEPYLLDKSMLIPFSDIDVRRDIASGAAGKVSLGTWRGMSVAVKKLYVLPSGDERQRFCAELSLHKTLRHRNVVQLLGVCSDPLCMVLEFMERGSLFACLRECDESELPWPLRLRCALDVARGMAFLHAESILHRDLKSLNVLVNEDWRCKVADFDQSRVDADTLTATVGTVLWSAPEVLMGRGDYGKEADVYSFGIVMWECWTREAPFQGPDAPTRHKVREHIISGKRPECSDELGRTPAEYDALMTACYSQDMGKRPTFPSIVSSLQVGVDGDMLRADDLPYGRRDTGTTASWSVHRRGTGSTASASDRLMLSIQSDEASFPSVPSVPEPRGWRRFLSFRSRAQDPKSAPLLPVAAHAQGI